MTDDFGINELNNTVDSQDSEAAIEATKQVVRTLAENALRGSPREPGVVVSKLTGPEYKLTKHLIEDNTSSNWIETLGWIRAAQHLGGVFNSERLSRHPEVLRLLADELKRAVLEVVDEQGPIKPGQINEYLSEKTDKQLSNRKEQCDSLIILGLIETTGSTRDRMWVITPFGRLMLRELKEDRWHEAEELLEAVLDETEKKLSSPEEIMKEVTTRYRVPLSVINRITRRLVNYIEKKEKEEKEEKTVSYSKKLQIKTMNMSNMHLNKSVNNKKTRERPITIKRNGPLSVKK